MKKQNRRKFIANTAALGSAAVASALPLTNNYNKKQMVHHVFFWLKNSGSEEDRNKLIEGVKSLSAIETVRKLHVGVPASTEKRDVVDASYDVSELMFFDDLEGQSTYQSHPVHLKFIEDYSHLWSKVVVYDVIEA